MSLRFAPSSPQTIGLELELQLLDKKTHDLADGIMPLMEFYPDTTYVKPEFIQNTVEVLTGICGSCDELAGNLVSVVRGVQKSCRQLGMELCGAGTHPFSQRLALITQQPRYLRMERASGYQSYIQVTYATHVHIGVESGQQAIDVMDRLRPLLPLLIAVSANSPFWRGHETGFVSYRQRILAASRSYGIPLAFGSWHKFAKFMETTRKAGIFETVKDIHWDIRPQPDIGTIEVRVMDAQSTVSAAVSLAALVRALVEYLRESRPEDTDGLPRPLHWWMEKENHYQASRQGLKANVVINENGDTRPLVEMWQQMFEIVRPIAVSLGDGDWIDGLQEMIHTGPGCRYQLDHYRSHGSFQGLVSHLASELERDLGRFPGAGVADRQETLEART